MMLALPVFYHPSTIIWVEDDPLFLKTILQLFGENYLIQPFQHPRKCLSFFENFSSFFSKNTLLRGSIENEYYDTVNHTPVDLNVPELHRLYHSPQRREEISVMIVDYHLPEMNGIELCRQLKNIPIKKILLTGEADYQEAIAAFNDNTIDRFIQKNSPSLMDEIELHVSTLMQHYFHGHTKSLLSHLEADHFLPLSDPIFINFFQQWRHQYSISEYYLIDKHGSLMLVNANQECFYFVLQTDRTLDDFIKLNDDVNDAEEYLAAVKKRQKIPFFGIGKESWQFETTEWPDYLYSPEILKGRENYYWAMVEKTAPT